MSAPVPHPGNPNDDRWYPPRREHVVNLETTHEYPDGTIIVREIGVEGGGWIETQDWYPLPNWQ